VRLGWTLVGVLVVVSCGAESGRSEDAARACELLTAEKDLQVPPPAMGTTSRSIGSSFVEYLDDSESNATLYVSLDHTEELETVADEVDALDGVKVVAVVDQDAAYEEFQDLFADSPELLETVDASILPGSVQVRAETDADLDALGEWAEGDPRIHEVIDIRQTGAVILGTVARAFPAELEELQEITDGDMNAAIKTVRAKDEPGLADITATFEAVSTYMADNCG
jgi:hypothetical protein